MQMVMASDETQIQIFANWPMSHAKRVTRDNRKNPEYHVVAAIRKLRTDTNCPAGRGTGKGEGGEGLVLFVLPVFLPSVICFYPN